MSARLSDANVFELISGLWTGERQPLMRAKVLRATNFRGDGVIDFEDVVTLDVEHRHAGTRRLQSGDIIIERSGGGANQPVGRAAIFVPPDDAPYFTSNFTTAIRIKDRALYEPRFVAHFLNALYLSGATEPLQRKPTGIRNLDWQEFLRFEVPRHDLSTQKSVADCLDAVRDASHTEVRQGDLARRLKSAAMRDLFTRGLREEPQRDTEVGLVPASWEVRRLEDDHDIAGGGTPLRSVDAYWSGGTIPWVKTGEVNYSVIRSTEERITQAGMDNSSARLLPPGTLLIAMFGQGVTRGRVAILGIEAACNQACAAVRPRNDRIDTRFLYHLLTSKYEELRQLAHGGQQQNLNIDIVRNFQVAVPQSREEQGEIVAILDAIDLKIELHRRKKAVLEELFKSLLHKLMTSEIRVADLDLSVLPAQQEART